MSRLGGRVRTLDTTMDYGAEWAPTTIRPTRAALRRVGAVILVASDILWTLATVTAVGLLAGLSYETGNVDVMTVADRFTAALAGCVVSAIAFTSVWYQRLLRERGR